MTRKSRVGLSFRKFIPASGAKKVMLISATVRKLLQCKYAGDGNLASPGAGVRRPNTVAGL